MFIVNVILTLSSMLLYVILAHAIMSWLIVLNVVSLQSQFWGRLWETLGRILEPIYRPIRRYVPPLGAIDSAPLVTLLAIIILQSILGPMGR